MQQFKTLGMLIKAPEGHNAEIRLVAALLYHCIDVYPYTITFFKSKDFGPEMLKGRGLPDKSFQSWKKLNQDTRKQRIAFIESKIVDIAADVMFNETPQSLREKLLEGNQEQFEKQLLSYEVVDNSYDMGRPQKSINKPQFGLL